MIQDILYPFCACLAFGIVFQLRGRKLLWSSVGGMIGWLVYRLCGQAIGSDIVCYFFATIVISAYSEWQARRCHAPAIIYLVIALLPLVPGGGIYQTMEHCIQGETNAALATGIHTIGIAGALTVGIVVVSSTVRLATRHDKHSR